MKKFYNSKPRLDSNGNLERTGLKIGEINKGVLLPGDPHRCEIMSKFFKEPKFLGRVGTYCAYSGKTNEDKDISVMSSGMGCDCIATALEDLSFAGASSVIRVGTCGGVVPGTVPGTIVIASGCVRGEGASYELVPPEYPAVADPYVVKALAKAAEELNEDYVIGMYRSHDAFYVESKAAHEGLRERMQKWIDIDVKVVENESGTLFTFGQLLGLRTGSICVALGSMFDDLDENGNAIYAAYQDPDYLKSRIETVTKIAVRAIEILEQEGHI